MENYLEGEKKKDRKKTARIWILIILFLLWMLLIFLIVENDLKAEDRIFYSVGDYYCTEEQYLKAEEIRPNQSSLSLELEKAREIEEEISSLRVGLEDSNSEIGEGYNKAIIEYNLQVEKYKEKESEYNQKVAEYNNFISENCEKSPNAE